jgi:outer membrane protein OmpA-like peptidoglycan-associated protein
MRANAAIAVVFWFACVVAGAQETVLKNEQVTESALADALAGKESAEGPRIRSFRPALTGAAASAPKKAGLLIVFGTDSAELMPQSRSILDTLGRALQSDRLARLSFSVEGHSVPRGSAEHNQRLSQLRAESVVSYLVKQHGVARERLTPMGKGSSEPINKERPDAAENRRVTIATKPN